MWKAVLFNSLVAICCLCPSSLMAQAASEFETLKKENELLMRENALLKKEIELLKKQIESNGGPDKAATDKKDKPGRATLHEVEYEFISLKMDGNEGHLIVAATNKSGKPKPFMLNAPVKLTTAEGKQHRSGVGKAATGRPWELQPDLRVEIPMKMGNIPSDFKEVDTILLEVVDGQGFRAARSNPLILKGPFKVER